MKLTIPIFFLILLSGCQVHPCQIEAPDKTFELAFGFNSYDSFVDIAKKLNLKVEGNCASDPVREVEVSPISWLGYSGKARLVFMGDRLKSIYFWPDSDAFFATQFENLNSSLSDSVDVSSRVDGEIKTTITKKFDNKKAIHVEDLRLSKVARKFLGP